MAELHLNYRQASSASTLPAQAGVFEIEEIDGLARYVLRGGTNVMRSISAALAMPLDQPLNRAASVGGCSALHLGPDEWLLLLGSDPANVLESQIREAAGGQAYALVDVSHRNVGLRMRGNAVADALASGCPQNLDIEAFPVGKCTRTVYHKAGIMLWRREQHEFMLETWRSFVPYLLDYLARETTLL
jgi:sarcosine oxidase subunit gamma